MKRYLKVCLLALASLALLSASAAAQQRSITGRVGNSVSDEPIVGATVAVVGTAIAAVTDAKGEFTLSAPDGPVSLSVRAIGFKRRTLAVPADQSRAAISVEPDIFNLEAVIVSGQATAVEQKNLPQAISVRDRAAEADPQVEAQLAASVEAAVEQALAALSPDAMTPKDALEALYRLKALLASEA